MTIILDLGLLVWLLQSQIGRQTHQSQARRLQLACFLNGSKPFHDLIMRVGTKTLPPLGHHPLWRFTYNLCTEKIKIKNKKLLEVVWRNQDIVSV